MAIRPWRPRSLRSNGPETPRSTSRVEIETTEANPPDSLADANRFWERHEGMRFHVDEDAYVVAARDGFPSTKDAELWVIRGDHPIDEREDPFRGSSTATRIRWTTSGRSSTTATACGSCCRATA